MINFKVISVATFVCLGSLSLADFQKSTRSHLGITLMPHYPDGLITFGIVKEKNGSLINHQVISKKNFLLIASGEMRSEANATLDNLFEKHKIPLCTISYNAPFRTYDINCPLTEQLWKVRYHRHPNHLNEEEKDADVLDPSLDSLNGWASFKIHPSDAQMNILSKYGISTVSDVIYGDSLWLFLNDVTNPTWIDNYKSN